MKNFSALAFLAGCVLLVMPVAPATANQEQAAIKAAEHFLFLVDTGQYAQSWDETAGFFKNLVPREEWVRQLKALRPAFGRLLKRKIRFKNSAQKLHGAPDGEYLVIQYATSFTGKREAMETVTPALEQDGHWRIVGYYIR